DASQLGRRHLPARVAIPGARGGRFACVDGRTAVYKVWTTVPAEISAVQALADRRAIARRVGAAVGRGLSTDSLRALDLRLKQARRGVSALWRAQADRGGSRAPPQRYGRTVAPARASRRARRPSARAARIRAHPPHPCHSTAS